MDISSLTKDSILFTVPSTGRFLKKTILYSGFKNPNKKIRETRNSSLFMNRIFVEQKNEGRKPDKNSILRKLEFMPRNLD